MTAWLHKPYFFVAAGLMAAVQTNKFINGSTDIGEALFLIPLGGVFWGAIATFVAKKLGKLDSNNEL